MQVVTDQDVAQNPNPTPELQSLISEAQEIRHKLEAKSLLETEYRQALGRKDAAALSRLKPNIHELQSQLGQMFARSHARDSGDYSQRVSLECDTCERTSGQWSQGCPGDDYPRPVIVHNDADEKSLIAYGRVQEALGNWEQAILEDRLKWRNSPTSLPNPVHAMGENLALDNQIASNLWSKLFPTLLVLMSVTGTFIRPSTWELAKKNGGTMETLLICPASRTEIVLGKFLTVLCFSICTAMLNLGSMGMTSGHITNMTGRMGQGAVVTLPGIGAIVTTMILLVPLAALFSALCLSLNICP